MMRTLGVVTFALAFLHHAAEAQRCACATTDLNVRSGPGTSYPVLYTMSTGECLPYRGVSQTGSGYTWYGVTYNGRSAWAARNWLNVRSCSGGSGRDGFCACATTDLNVRSGPSTNHPVLYTLSAGQCLPYRSLSQTGSGYTWYGVTYRGQLAWAARNWLNIGYCL